MLSAAATAAAAAAAAVAAAAAAAELGDSQHGDMGAEADLLSTHHAIQQCPMELFRQYV